MSDSIVDTNIPVTRLPFGANLPPKVPYADADNVGSDTKPLKLVNKKLVEVEGELAPKLAPTFVRKDTGTTVNDVPTSPTPTAADPDGMVATKGYVDAYVQNSIGTKGGDLRHVYTLNGEIVPSSGNLNEDGKSLVKMTDGVWSLSSGNVGSVDKPIYLKDGTLTEGKTPVHRVTVTPAGDGDVLIATIDVDGTITRIKAGSGGGGSGISTLDVPLLTPMFFDYEYHKSGDVICWIPAIHANEATATSHSDSGYKSMYFGRHQCTVTSDTTRNSSKTYYVYDSALEDFRPCVATDFNVEGGFKSGTTYYEFANRGYKKIYDHLVKEASAGTAKSKTYACSSGNVTINYKQAADGHNIIICANDTEVNAAVTNLTTLYNDTEIGTAWYYVLDTGRKRFRLPRTRYSLHGDRTYAKTAQEGNASLKLYFHTGNRDEEEQSGSQLDDLFDMMYPVGSIYTTIAVSLPAWFTSNGRTWEPIGKGRCLWGVESDSDLDQPLDWLLPQHKHTYARAMSVDSSQYGGAGVGKISLGNSASTSLYPPNNDPHIGNDTVRPTSVGVNFWKRTS